jgi:hypothetical protein
MDGDASGWIVALQIYVDGMSWKSQNAKECKK